MNFSTKTFCEINRPVDQASGTEICVATTTEIGSSSLPAVLNGFTHGEILQSWFLFLIFVSGAFSFLFFWVRGFRIRQK